MSEASAETVQSQPVDARHQPLVIVLAAVATGIVADRFCGVPLGLWWFVAIAGAIAWFVGRWGGRDRTAAAVLLLAVMATAAAWHHCRWRLFADDDLGHFTRDADEPTCIEVIALQVPRSVAQPAQDPMRAMPIGDMVRLDVAPVAIRDAARWRPVSGRARLSVSAKLCGVQAGDRLQIFGQLSKPAPASNPGEFDYADYLRGQRIGSQIHAQHAECVTPVAAGRSWSILRLLEQLRAHSGRLLAEHLDPRRAALASAVLLGQRELLDPEVTETFMETGSIHLVVIAGLHVGILVSALLFVLRRLAMPRGVRLATVAAFVVLYALMVDAHPPVVRATILVVVSCWSLYLGRSALGFNTLAAAALVVLALNPVDLFNVGAQLSFLCVAALVWFAPWWSDREKQRSHLDRLIAENQAWLAWMLSWLLQRLRVLAIVGAVIWLASVPLVMARFHIFAPAALVINMVIWPPVEFALLSGWATVALGTLAWPLGSICGGAANLAFWLLEGMVIGVKHFPCSHFYVPGPPDWWLVGFYGGLAAMAAFPRLRPPRRWCFGMLAGWVAVGFGASLWQHASFRSSGRVDCTFLAMNHGCAVLLELPSGQTMLYDAGRMGAPVAASRSIASTLWSRGITHIDAVVLSHSDVDHYNAIPNLLERFSVGVVYVSPVMFERNSRATESLKAAIAAAGVPVREIRAGDELRGGPECRIEVLHPPRHGILGTDNANSVVLAVQCGRHRIVLPGDLEGRGMEELLAEQPMPCDVLLVPHHGSQQSNPPGLAAWCTPRWVVISGSRRWDTQPIRAAYQAVGSQVIETIDSGAVRASIGPTGVRLEGFCGGR
jgi:competence protein ComEC